MLPGSSARHAAVALALSVLAAGCSAPGGERVTAVEERLALVEGRMAAVESVATTGPVEAEKTDFRTSLDAAVVQAAIDDADVEAEVVTLELDPAVDLVKAAIQPAGDADADVAWEAAKALAPLFADLVAYAPALDLQVGDTRCTCSTALMKGIAKGAVDRQVWDTVCRA